FLAALYQAVLRRPLDPTGAKIFGQQLAGGTSRTDVASTILGSMEFHSLQINDLYTQLLHRPSDAGGFSFFLDQLQHGVHIEQVVGAIASSDEYVAKAGGNGNQLFVMHLYQDLLGRPAETRVVSTFGAQLDAGSLTRRALVTAVEGSTEYRNKVVDSLYVQLLGRHADPTALSKWLGFLSQGGTMQQVEDLLLASDEYFAGHGGGSNAGFLRALFQDVLARQIDPTGLQVFSQALANGVSRQKVALSVLSSAEADTLAVVGFYNRFLHRAADPAGTTANVNILKRGTTLEDMIALFLTSPEYFART